MSVCVLSSLLRWIVHHFNETMTSAIKFMVSIISFKDRSRGTRYRSFFKITQFFVRRQSNYSSCHHNNECYILLDKFVRVFILSLDGYHVKLKPGNRNFVIHFHWTLFHGIYFMIVETILSVIWIIIKCSSLCTQKIRTKIEYIKNSAPRNKFKCNC